MSAAKLKCIDDYDIRAHLLTNIPVYASELDRIRSGIIATRVLPVSLLRIIADYTDGPYTDDIIRMWKKVHRSRGDRDRWYKNVKNFTKLKTTREEREYHMGLHSYFYDNISDKQTIEEYMEDDLYAPSEDQELPLLNDIFEYLGLNGNYQSIEKLKQDTNSYEIMMSYVFSIDHLRSCGSALIAPKYIVSFEMIAGIYTLIYAHQYYQDNPGAHLPKLPVWDYESMQYVPYKRLDAMTPDTQRDRNTREYYAKMAANLNNV